MESISVADYMTAYHLGDGLAVGAYSLEAVRAAKEKSAREKDLADLEEINRIGTDAERYARVKPSIQNMRIECIAHGQ